MSWLTSLPLLASKAFVLAQMQACPAPMAAPIGEVYFAMEPPLYVTDAPSSVLTESQRKNPNSPIAKESKWMVGGLNDGRTEIKINASYTVAFDQTASCLYFNTVTMTIVYKPTIYIASDYAHQACRSHVIRRHEERHTAVDVKTFKEFVPKMKMDLLWYLRSTSAMGPYSQDQIPAAQKQSFDALYAAGEKILSKLDKTRGDRQSAIDTIENYKQESGLCPGEFPTIEELEKNSPPPAPTP